MKNVKITSMNNKEAMLFLLKAKSYCTIKLPDYIDFQPLLDEIHNKNKNKKDLNNFCIEGENPKFHKNVNYDILVTKKDKYSWRKLTIMNPIIYVAIVHKICDEKNWEIILKRFHQFSKIKNIKCCSIPVESTNLVADKREQILNWWNEFEQSTITESINYKYMIITDIQNCYPSIYTHSISWALHGKDLIKYNWTNKKHNKLLGDEIDKMLEAASYGQTNGIFQGNILCDLIAELVLGYYDLLLSKRLNEIGLTDYKILRYRDDYRIFSNTKSNVEIIYRELGNILNENSLYLSEKKTKFTGDIVGNSLKEDKVYGLINPIDISLNPQKKLFVIREMSIKYKNSGLLVRLLHQYYNDVIEPLDRKPNSCKQIISIIVDIMNNNSRVYPECVAILIKLFKFYKSSTRMLYINKINKNLSYQIIDKDFLNIWMQRLSITEDVSFKYDTKLCQKLYMHNNIWDCSWSKISIDESAIINKDKLAKMKIEVSKEEFDDFLIDVY